MNANSPRSAPFSRTISSAWLISPLISTAAKFAFALSSARPKSPFGMKLTRALAVAARSSPCPAREVPDDRRGLLSARLSRGRVLFSFHPPRHGHVHSPIEAERRETHHL